MTWRRVAAYPAESHWHSFRQRHRHWGARLGAEVIHFVIEQKSGTLNDYTAAERPVDRVGVGYRITPLVDNRIMRCVR